MKVMKHGHYLESYQNIDKRISYLINGYYFVWKHIKNFKDDNLVHDAGSTLHSLEIVPSIPIGSGTTQP